MANRLMLFAHFMALAAEQGHRLINFAFHSYSDLFETTRRDIYCRFPADGRRSWMDIVPGVRPVLRKTRLCLRLASGASVLNERLPLFGKKVVTLLEHPGVNDLAGPEVQNAIRDARIVLARGWMFRSPTDWLQRHAEKIRAYFRPVAGFECAGNQAVERLRQNADVVVGVHIRHGDYREWKDGQFYFRVSRYVEWMRQLGAQLPGRKVAYLVCSDEPRSESEFPGLSVGIGAGSALGDLQALSRCDYIFGPQSTFSQWASFYGNKPLQLLYGADSSLELHKFHVSWLDV
jgi:hypothetical protein